MKPIKRLERVVTGALIIYIFYGVMCFVPVAASAENPLLRVEKFVKAYQANPYDLNGDGVVDSKDLMTIRSEFVYALKYRNRLPAEWLKVLDMNHDGRFDARDMSIAVIQTDRAIANMKKINDFAGWLGRDPLDLDRNRRITTSDIQLVQERYGLVITYSAYLKIPMDLDVNKDGAVTRRIWRTLSATYGPPLMI